MRKENMESNPILKLIFDFSLAVIEYCELLEAKKKYILSRKLLKSGTSIGSNSYEAQNAESKANFIYKFKISAKEVNETQYWLSLCKYSKSYPNCDHLLVRLDEIDKIITKINSFSKKAQVL